MERRSVCEVKKSNIKEPSMVFDTITKRYRCFQGYQKDNKHLSGVGKLVCNLGRETSNFLEVKPSKERLVEKFETIETVLKPVVDWGKVVKNSEHLINEVINYQNFVKKQSHEVRHADYQRGYEDVCKHMVLNKKKYIQFPTRFRDPLRYTRLVHEKEKETIEYLSELASKDWKNLPPLPLHTGNKSKRMNESYMKFRHRQVMTCALKKPEKKHKLYHQFDHLNIPLVLSNCDDVTIATPYSVESMRKNNKNHRKIIENMTPRKRDLKYKILTNMICQPKEHNERSRRLLAKYLMDFKFLDKYRNITPVVIDRQHLIEKLPKYQPHIKIPTPAKLMKSSELNILRNSTIWLTNVDEISEDMENILFHEDFDSVREKELIYSDYCRYIDSRKERSIKNGKDAIFFPTKLLDPCSRGIATIDQEKRLSKKLDEFIGYKFYDPYHHVTNCYHRNNLKERKIADKNRKDCEEKIRNYLPPICTIDPTTYPPSPRPTKKEPKLFLGKSEKRPQLPLLIEHCDPVDPIISDTKVIFPEPELMELSSVSEITFSGTSVITPVEISKAELAAERKRNMSKHRKIL
ncbi:hypothetical protein SNEBB_008676 [Seison nebaliae]|nr:hypothetical protein SNEBB_008676 [Seison nebaliae]